MAISDLLAKPIKSLAARAGYTGPQKLRYDVASYQALRRLRNWQPGDVVFDVGANDGQTVLRLQQHLPSPRVLAFEPVSATFDVLLERTAHVPNLECFKLAMGSGSGEREIYVNQSSTLSSLHSDWGDAQVVETIEITTLDRFVEEHPVPCIHLLKIDVEGHDLEVLKGAERLLAASRIEIVMVEAGFGAPGRPQPTLSQIQDYLRPFGCHLHGIYNQCRAPLGRYFGLSKNADGIPNVLVYCDALFVSGHKPATCLSEAKPAGQA